MISSIAILPLSSAAEAEKAIKAAKAPGKDHASTGGIVEDGDTSGNDDDHSVDPSTRDTDDDRGTTTPARANTEPDLNPSTSVAEDVIGRRGQYGQFAERWFSRNGWVPGRGQVTGAAASTFKAVGQFARSTGEAVLPQSVAGPPAAAPKETPPIAISLLPKLLKTMTMMLCSRSFFFSYDLDVTRRLGTGVRKTDLPLHKVADPLVWLPLAVQLQITYCPQFFWNRHLSTDLLESGLHGFVLPVMQGFVGQRAFVVPDDSSDATPVPVEKTEASTDTRKKPQGQDYRMTLISRRSVKRSGLRYLRRGVDEEGQAANTVETEQILSRVSKGQDAVSMSFTQLRGSIPLYFSQSPYSFKPAPILRHSTEVNQAAFKRHFKFVQDRYGRVQIALLVDKRGVEAPIGQEYEKYVDRLNDDKKAEDNSKLGFCWFAFHEECRGMKFENVCRLVSSLESTLASCGYTKHADGKVQKRQLGVCRTNCMDCLDRTNVCQSAFGRHMLKRQMENLGMKEMDLQFGEHSRWFNTLWADNGDAISKQYASTAALKGDYTRTSKRNYQGALTDFSLTLSRYYSNIVNDYFSQAVIDYLLGNVTAAVFEEFEANLFSADPGMSISKIRQNAIDVSAKIVIENEAEDLRCGFVLLTPSHTSTLRSFPLEQVVFLLTSHAMYLVHFDWNTEKVQSFEKLDLEGIVSIQRGTYITSTFSTSDTDPSRNVGFVVKYKPLKTHIARVNTRSMSTSLDAPPKPGRQGKSKGAGEFMAFKTPPRSSTASGSGGPQEAEASMSEVAVIDSVCDEVGRAMGQPLDDLVEKKDIISLDEAKKKTGYLEQMGNSLKRYIWA